MRLSDLELPAKFVDWRPGQLDAAITAACSDTRFTVLNMPPGTGKTPMYVAASRITDSRTLVLTHTKGLQNQISGDFAVIGMKEIKGQSNYPCIWLQELGNEDGNCEDGPCHASLQCSYRDGGCYYFDAVRAARNAKLVVANYSYWMHLQRYSEPDTLGKFDLLVLDEAHEAVNALSDFVKTEIVAKEIERLVGIKLIRSQHLPEWVEWAEEVIRECRVRLASAKASSGLFVGHIPTVKALKRLEANLLDLVMASRWRHSDVPNPTAWVPGQSIDWLIEQDSTKVSFQPVWPAAYAETYLFGKIPRVLLVSATVTPREAIYLGLRKSSVTFKSYPSPFHRDNRPVWYIPTARVGYRMTDAEERIWLNRINEIIAMFPDRKGIIHTVSYDRAKLICESSPHYYRLLTHDSRDLKRVVARYRDSAPGTFLVSPSVSTGWDFPGDECRVQIIAKIPFTDGRDPLTKARVKQDREYSNYIALTELIQMSGRGNRSEEDWCDTFIIDDHWKWFRENVRPYTPKWFYSGVRRVGYLSDVRPRAMPRSRVLTAKRARW